MDYTVKNGRIYTENGLPYEPRWFCDGRLALKFENGSINQVDFFGPETSGNYIVFYSAFGTDCVCLSMRTGIAPH